MKKYNRRNFIRDTALGISAVGMFSVNDRLSFYQSDILPVERSGNSGSKSYDPLLDKNCKIIYPPQAAKSKALWMWYPGQKTAHINSRRIRDAIERCNNMGYPGNFCQPVYYVYFRKQVNVEIDSEIRWSGPLSRIRMSIDGKEGDITTRHIILPAGKHLIIASIDFSESLPCIIIEGKGLSSPEGWQTSTDQQIWTEPEFEEFYGCPGILPDNKREIVVEIPVSSVVSAHNVQANENGFVFSNGGSLIVDFWHDELGNLSFSANGDSNLSINMGESLSEVQDIDPSHDEQKGIPPIELSKYPLPVLLPERCVRFAHIRSEGTAVIKKLHLKARITPVDYKGSFSCSDDELNTIWAAGAATIHSCMHDFYLDGIKRDAVSWADANMGMMAGDCVFFDSIIAHNSIVSQLLPVKTSVMDLGIIDYPPFTYLGFEHDYLVRGDLGFAKRYKQNMYDLLDLYISLQNEKGFINGKDFRSWGFFPDWSITDETGPDRYGIPCYSQMLIMKSFEIGSNFSRKFEDVTISEKYAQIASKLRKNIRETFWDASNGVFVNGIDSNGKLDRRLTSFAQVWGILFDVVKPAEYRTIFEKVLDNPERKKLSVSLNQLFEGLAYSKAGRIGTFLSRLKTIWGGMLSEGYSRFAEDIRPWQNPAEKLMLYGRPYANSLCHVWSGATPVLALSKGVLGIQPTGPAFSECIVNPQMAGLDWIKGSIPTPSGNISLELDRMKGGKLSLPSGVKAKLIGLNEKTGKTELIGPGVFLVET